jgi:general secretion pathway protein I
LKARGFTLVEVLVALVIVAAGASAVLSALNSAASSTVYLRDKTFAQWIAGNRIAETRLATTRAPSGKTEGELDYAGRRWKWRQQVSDGEIPGLARIDVSVRPIVPGAPAAAAGAAADEAWTITLSGVLGRDVAPPGGSIEWEPAPTGPGSAGEGAENGAGATNDAPPGTNAGGEAGNAAGAGT